MYKIDIFKRDFTNVFSYQIDNIVHTFDYLNQGTNDFEVYNLSENVEAGQYVQIIKDDECYCGIISKIEKLNNNISKVIYKSLLSLFDINVLIDTDDQGKGSLENFIIKIIENNFINSDDKSMNIQGLTIAGISYTKNWGFNLKSDKENMHMCIVNFYNSICIRALEKYGVVIEPIFYNKKIIFKIGKIQNPKLKFESNLKNIINKSMVIKESDKKVNALIIYNTSNYQNKMMYFLHKDGSYSTVDKDRILPVHRELIGVDIEQDKTFEESARLLADEKFGNITYNNLIEFEVFKDDNIFNPLQLKIGQEVSIIDAGNSYNSILTRKKIDKTIVLSFGIIRNEFTSKIRRMMK
ncbi:hypothetical protein B7939_00470 [Eggerthia catenaformis]|nr:hypothetical protein B7939_00470 [Eggerthia catenaformis]